MTSACGIAAVVLAAGESSRMGKPKPLLPLGPQTAIERLVGSVAESQVRDIVVVTGHDPEEILPVLQGLPVRRVHNLRYESGMFSSVLAGVGALSKDIEAFFILPADHPLIIPGTLDRLIDAFRDRGQRIVHPVCCGVRGHPPLLSGRFTKALLETSGPTNLRDFFARHSQDEAEIEIEDLTILMDMDTKEDYARIGRFAAFLDAHEQSTAYAANGAAGRLSDKKVRLLSSEDALYVLSLLEVPEQVIRHGRAVAKVGEKLALALQPRLPHLDVDLVRTAGLLHDMAKAVPKHAVVAQNILQNLGLSRLGAVVGGHMVLSAEQADTYPPTEEQLVYLADKMVVEDEVASVEARAAHALSAQNHDAAATEGVRRRIGTAEMIRKRIETILGRPLEEVLPRETKSST